MRKMAFLMAYSFISKIYFEILETYRESPWGIHSSSKFNFSSACPFNSSGFAHSGSAHQIALNLVFRDHNCTAGNLSFP